MAELTNEELCALTAAGDEKSFDILLKRNAGFLHVFVWKAWKGISDFEVDRSLAYDDLHQIAVIAFWEAVQKYGSERDAQFISFAGTVINSRLTDELKKAYVDHAASGAFIRFDKELDDEDGPAFKETHLYHFQQMPDVIFFKRELRRVVRKAVSLLSPRERMFILYRYGFISGEYMTMTEACRVFSLTETTAKALEGKAFQNIRAEYEKYYKSNIEILISAEQFLREDEGIYIPFVPPGVRRNLPFPSTPDEKALVE